ncbi:hypothetical protein BDV19DRAFT_64938 [Aspergillus venezuelensis]
MFYNSTKHFCLSTPVDSQCEPRLAERGDERERLISDSIISRISQRRCVPYHITRIALLYNGILVHPVVNDIRTGNRWLYHAAARLSRYDQRALTEIPTHRELVIAFSSQQHQRHPAHTVASYEHGIRREYVLTARVLVAQTSRRSGSRV